MALNTEQELLDVVDTADRVVGVMTRGDIHAQGLMHRAVHILVFNSEGLLLIQKRSMNKDENPGLWDTSAAGHVDSGESYLACAMRELDEELGIVVNTEPEPLFQLPPTPRTGMEHSKVYRYLHDGRLTLQTDEIDEVRWVSAEELNRNLILSGDELTTVFSIIWTQYQRMCTSAE